MEMTRKEFLGSIAGATAYAAVSSAPRAANAATSAPPSKWKVRRGVSLYSYVGELYSSMTMEDAFMEMDDMGARGLEILSEAHIPDYPNPSNAWVDHWFKMLDKYRITPVFYSSWLEDDTPDNTFDYLLRDMRLANRLGFKRIRPKVAGGRRTRGQTPTRRPPTQQQGVRQGPGYGSQVDPKWEDFVLRVLPYAEKLDVRVSAGEIHEPSVLDMPVWHDVVAFCQKTKTQYFGLHIDSSIFSTRRARLGDSAFETEPDPEREKQSANRPLGPHSDPKELIPVLPYTLGFHFKFWEMQEDFTEYSIPFDRIIAALKEGGFDGWTFSEYEGPRTQGLASMQLRRQHVMLKRLLGEYQSA